MLQSSLLLGLLAVVSATAGPANTSDSVPQPTDLVYLLVRHHRPIYPDEGIYKGHRLVTKTQDLMVENIASSSVPLKNNWFLLRFGRRQRERSVYFMAYFRAPPSPMRGVEPVSNVEMEFRFVHAPQLDFRWQVSSSANHFKYLGARPTSNGLHNSGYRVICKPGSVFAIHLKVKNFRRNMPFRMLRMYVTHNGQRQYAQIVGMQKPEIQKVEIPTVEAPPPALEQLNSDSDRVLLSQPVTVTDIKRFGVVPEGGNEFYMTGYYRPRQAQTKFVLSSTVPVKVEVHAATHLKYNKEYALFTLEAHDGMACEMERLLDTKMYYKIVLMGTLSEQLRYDFTLLHFDSKNPLSGSGVVLLIPDFKKLALTLALGELDGTTTDPALDFLQKLSPVADKPRRPLRAPG